MIGSAYNLAIEQKLVIRNPAQGCALPKLEHREMKTLTAEQLGAFLREAKESSVYELYYLDLATGLRRGELLGLKWSDIDFQRGTLKIQRAISRQNGEVTVAPLKTKKRLSHAAALGRRGRRSLRTKEKGWQQRMDISIAYWWTDVARQRTASAATSPEAGRLAEDQIS